jgi:hypothetical protein
MRITLHLDSFECADSSAYAILWLDKQACKWSREGHASMNLPGWGTLEYTQGDTRIMSPEHEQVLCMLEGLDLGASTGPFEGEEGTVRWYRHAHHTPVTGHWHVQWIDPTEADPEQGVFADDEV